MVASVLVAAVSRVWLPCRRRHARWRRAAPAWVAPSSPHATLPCSPPTFFCSLGVELAGCGAPRQRGPGRAQALHGGGAAGAGPLQPPGPLPLGLPQAQDQQQRRLRRQQRGRQQRRHDAAARAVSARSGTGGADCCVLPAPASAASLNSLHTHRLDLHRVMTVHTPPSPRPPLCFPLHCPLARFFSFRPFLTQPAATHVSPPSAPCVACIFRAGPLAEPCSERGTVSFLSQPFERATDSARHPVTSLPP